LVAHFFLYIFHNFRFIEEFLCIFYLTLPNLTDCKTKLIKYACYDDIYKWHKFSLIKYISDWVTNQNGALSHLQEMYLKQCLRTNMGERMKRTERKQGKLGWNNFRMYRF
jgi:hypothetical protein